MNDSEKEGITRDEIKKEFQVERMILFSDAVFAIVITLMAIEIKLPETEHRITEGELPHALMHLLPHIIGYVISFMFIGLIWYQHLKIFSLLKDYDKGLVLRNLILLFFVGLFPFSAALIAKVSGMITIFIYFSIICCCIFSLYFLYHYIVIKRPELRMNIDMTEHIEELRKRKIALIAFTAAFIPIAITYFMISDPNLKGLSTMWMLLFPVVYKVLTKKKKPVQT